MSRSGDVRRSGPAWSAGLLLFLACTGLFPRSATAQLGGLFVNVTSPTDGSTVGGTVTVTASAGAPTGIQGVQFTLDGANLGAEDTSAPYSIPWNTLATGNGQHTLRAIARDTLGIRYTSNPVVVTVFNDTTPPTVAITSPAAGAAVTGTVTVAANASDNVGVVGVRFTLNGAALGAEDTTSPYSTTWNAGAASPGSYSLRAIARDAAGNSTTSTEVVVTVADTTPPTVSLTAPASGSTVSGTITVSATATDNVGVAGVQFQLDGIAFGAEDTTAPYSVSWDTRSSSNGSHTLRAVARDAAGNTRTSAPSSVTVDNGPPPDTTAPTVAITAPASGATVSRTITVTATATDNVGVTGVQFRLDGVALGAEDTSAPYSVTWNTRTATPGAHSLTAVARDAAGNLGTAPAVSVTVSNVGVGDVFVGMLDGKVQWHAPDGTLRQTLTGGSDGEASGLAFDAAGNLYVPHWYSRIPLTPGNLVTRFDDNGSYLGTFGTGYDCNPSSFAFDAAGNVYVGQADCSGDILKLDAAGSPITSFDAAVGVRGADHIDLAPDGCTMFYSNWTKNVLRYDVCTRTQLPNFNTQPLPGDTAYHIRLLPDGGVLVADSQFIVRLNSNGNEVRRYFILTESNWWTGLDVAGDGTFWANNLATSNLYRFDIETGNVVAMFNAGVPAWTVVGVAVKP